MAFNFYTEDIDLPNIDFEQIKSWLQDVIGDHMKSVGNITYVFCSDNYILNINKQFLNHDYFTDIISFNYSTQRLISGDLFVSLDTVKSNSELFGSDFNIELSRVIVHGVLHLLGWDDKTDEERIVMREKENYWLSKLTK